MAEAEFTSPQADGPPQRGASAPPWTDLPPGIVPHPAELPADALLRACRLTRTRRGGPGGQHRNKVETAVVLHHEPTGAGAEANECRSGEENRREALFRLRLRLAVGFRSPFPPERSPGPCWTGRVRGGRPAINPRHEDFPALLAMVLDCLAAHALDPAATAARLGITSSQLMKFIRHEPRAWSAVNILRTARGLHPLH